MTPFLWPVHPSPLDAECLSSWLRRTAMIYGLTVKELVRHGLDSGQWRRHWLDIDPPDRFLHAIAARTRVPFETIKRTTVGWARPFLFAFFDRKYYYQNSVLLARPKPTQYCLNNWILRQESARTLTACRVCLQTYPDAGILLPWRLRILTSCPIHGIMLESMRIKEAFVECLKDTVEVAPESVRSLDLLTWSAFTTGYVNLPAGVVHASVWFRLLRTILEELARPVEPHTEYDQQILSVWATVDRFLQTKTDSWNWKFKGEWKHALTLATAIDMMKNETIVPAGPDGRYFFRDEISGFRLPQKVGSGGDICATPTS